MLVEPPQNGEYLVAAYIITAVILLGYFGALWRRARDVLARDSSSRASRGT